MKFLDIFKIFFVLLLSILFVQPLEAAFEHFYQSYLSETVLQMNQNVGRSKETLGFYCQSTQLFGMKSLQVATCELTWRKRIQQYSFRYQQLGTIKYQEMTSSFAIQTTLSQNIDIKIGFHFHHLHIKDHLSSHVTSFTILSTYHLPQECFGFFISNLTHAKLSDDPSPLTQQFSSFYTHNIVNYFSITLQGTKDMLYPLVFSAYLMFKPIKHIYTQMSFSNSNQYASWGIGFILSKMQFNYRCDIHSYLGTSHAISFFCSIR